MKRGFFRDTADDIWFEELSWTGKWVRFRTKQDTMIRGISIIAEGTEYPGDLICSLSDYGIAKGTQAYVYTQKARVFVGLPYWLVIVYDGKVGECKLQV